MKCGNGHDHETVAEVRACYGVKAVTYSGANATGNESWRSEPATDKQYVLLARLRKQYQVAAQHSGEMTKGQASEEINDLKEYGRQQAQKVTAPARINTVSAVDHADLGSGSGLESGPFKPEAPRERKPFPKVPGGYYATVSRTGNNDFDFWFVNPVKGGRWDGFLRVSRVIGGRPNVRVPATVARAALEAIKTEGEDACGNRFADELERCRDCGRHLTDELSRQRRKGPDCYAKNGV